MAKSAKEADSRGSYFYIYVTHDNITNLQQLCNGKMFCVNVLFERIFLWANKKFTEIQIETSIK